MKYSALAFYPILVLSLAGCVPAIIGGAGVVGVAATEERSLGDNIDDRSISTEIHHYFAVSEMNGLLQDISVRVHEGRVMLTGRTGTTPVALEAVRLAWQAAGVKEVINAVEVGQEGTNLLDYTQDNLVETQIEARLLATRGIRSINFTVEVVDGVAYLLGVAQSEEERRNVAYIASVSKGVRKVMSYIRLKDSPKRLEKTGKIREKGINRDWGSVIHE